jgi:hypothetical protein
MEAQGFGVEQQPAACQEPAAWLKRSRDRGLALPVCSELLGTIWMADNNLSPLEKRPQLDEKLWLVLSQQVASSQQARHCSRLLRARIRTAETMQDSH